MLVDYSEELEQGNFVGIIGTLYSNGVLKIQMVDEPIQVVSIPEELCMLSDKEFYIRDCILNEAAYAACDRSKKHNLFGGYCVITDAWRSRSIR